MPMLKYCSLKARTLLKRLQHRCFPLKIAKFLRTPILRTSANGFFCFLKTITLMTIISLPNRTNLKIHDIHWVKSVQRWSFSWSVFSCIRTKYGDLQISAFSPNTGK